MELFAKIVCFPPLNQLTVIAREQEKIEFTVLLEASKALPQPGWEVSVWHNCPTETSNDARPWKDLPLVQSASKPFDMASASSLTYYRYTFTAALQLPTDRHAANLANFTIKFRAGSHVQWQWVKDQFGMSDGSLLLSQGKTENCTTAWASSVFGDYHLRQWNITSLQSECPEAVLFKVESKNPIPRNGVDDAKFETEIFGSSQTGFHRYMALVRIWTPWLAPRQGTDRFHITEDALFCSFLTHGGQHVVLLPMNGVNDTVTVFRSDGEGHIIVAARNDGVAEGRFLFLAAIADEFEVANAAVMYEARNMILRNRSSSEQTSIKTAQSNSESHDVDNSLASNDGKKQEPQWLEEWYDGLTYCTWNALGQDLSDKKLFAALDDLATNNIHVSGLIIDDNWQSLDGVQGQISQFKRGWTDFEANRDGFPEGLKWTVTKIKTQHPAISNITVWHGLHGYWGGLASSGTIAKNYKTVEVEKQAGIAGGTMLVVDPSDIHRMYDDFYRFLSSCGITSVKTDVQFYLDLLASTSDRRTLTTAYQSAWTTAHLRHFAGKAISCMSQIPQILFHSFLPVNSPKILLRNSDDFFPTIPASHPWHVFSNAHNALFVQHLNVLPDWDMFQTSHPYSGFHAAARCVSGGPIYITDALGEHDLDLIAQMTAENVRGQTVILRPSIIGKAISMYDQYHEGQVLKVGTYNGVAQTGNGILGLFNVSDHEISAMIPITDFPGVNAPNLAEDGNPKSEPSARFLIRSHTTGGISDPITPERSNPSSNLISLTLSIRGYDILTAHPLYNFSLPVPTQKQTTSSSSPSPSPSSPATSLAILGLLGKMTGACAITSTLVEALAPTRLQIHVSLKALGTLGIWISDLGARIIDEEFLITILGQVVPRARVRKQVLAPAESVDGGGGVGGALGEGNHAGVLEVDLLGAWKDMKLDSGWSNEVTVRVFIQSHTTDGEGKK